MSFVFSGPRLIHWDCQALCLGPPDCRAPPVLAISLILSRGFLLPADPLSAREDVAEEAGDVVLGGDDTAGGMDEGRDIGSPGNPAAIAAAAAAAPEGPLAAAPAAAICC